MKNSNFFVVFIGSICFTFSANTLAQNITAVFSPKRGVVCDKYICADKKALLHKPICKGFFSDIIFK
ncbi:YcgJ family protein, partial [Acinetobacter baumannii]|uniref:YcgJ family protein n=1 Tax=Acinetobacter baumannii TaxID=470 RepID=UPI0005EB5020